MSSPHRLSRAPLVLPPANRWWFVLGREPLLSAAEIFSVLPGVIFVDNACQYNPPFLRVHTAVDPTIIQKLGGTIKIAQELHTGLTEHELLSALTTQCEQIGGKITFGISNYSGTAEQSEMWAKEIKKRLKSGQRSVRYISSSEGVLNSAAVYHNQLHSTGAEFLIVSSEQGYDVAVTKAVQPLEELSARDYGRPGRDDVSGMLPPKLAMMMVNVAISDIRFKISDLTILDPFCGSGTILTEAARLGIKKLFGTDVSQKAIIDSTRNVEWTVTSQNLKSQILNLKLTVCDVSHLTDCIPTNSVDIIATEPYMGPPLRGSESPDKIKKNCADLADLYVQAFAEFAKILRDDAAVVMVIPRFFVKTNVYTISDRIIPKLSQLGFRKERILPEALSPQTYVLYHRPGQHVGREIWKFTKNKKQP